MTLCQRPIASKDALRLTFQIDHTPPIERNLGSKTDEETGDGVYSEGIDCNISVPLGNMVTLFSSVKGNNEQKDHHIFEQ